MTNWAAEFSDALAEVLQYAIVEGVEETRKALAVLEEIHVRGYTVTLLRRIQEARALLAQEVPVAPPQ